MKYNIYCAECGTEYEVEMSFAPRYCVKCGYDFPDVQPVKAKSRVCAESWMQELDDLQPRVLAARTECVRLMAEYEDLLQHLRIYKNRGIVTQDELDRYTGLRDNVRTLAAEIKAYRKGKREVLPEQVGQK